MKCAPTVALLCALLAFGSAQDVSQGSQVEDVPKCSSLNSVSTTTSCSRSGKWVSCDSPVPPETRAEISCLVGYQLDKNSVTTQGSIVECSQNGKWEPDPVRCTAVCGIVSPHQKPLILNSNTPYISDLPWHASVYTGSTSPEGVRKEFQCGATIIHSKLLLTSASCIYDEATKRTVEPKRLFVLTGNVFSDYDSELHNPQIVKKAAVKNAYAHCDYSGIIGNYAWDIALLELQEPLQFSRILLPACLDLGGHSDQILEPGALGKVATFGRSGNSSISDIMKTLTLPYVTNNQCKSSLHSEEDGVFITPDKFCSGYTNGTALCDGDRGNGLVFRKNELWYVLGVVSISLGIDLSNGERTCDRYSYSTHTKVSNYIPWIQNAISAIEKSEPFPTCE